MWAALVLQGGGEGCGVWAAAALAVDRGGYFFVCFIFLSCFLFGFYSCWCLHIFADQTTQRQGARRASCELVWSLDVVVVPCGNVQHLKKVVFTNDISAGGEKGAGNQ